MYASDKKIKLRPFCDSDIVLFAKWLCAAHVAKWYENPQDRLDEINECTGEYSFIRHFITELNGEPIGFCQYYEYSKGGESWHGILTQPVRTA